MSILDFTYEMLKIFWWVLLLAIPGVYLISHDLLKGLHEKIYTKNYKLEDPLGGFTERELDELLLAEI